MSSTRHQSSWLVYYQISLLSIQLFLGVSSFPGDFTEPPQFECEVLCSFKSEVKEWFCTGK
jgi:hypothetical protein